MIQIRVARQEDQPVIRRLVLRAHLNPLSLGWRQFRLAVDDRGQVIGCGQVRQHGDGSRELASIIVAEGWRGRGVARAVIERLMAEAGPPLWLTCRSGLKGFYARFGFREADPADRLPAYLRRMRSLAEALSVLFAREERLAVMLWEGE
jgi:N-acetylglutamate synthase-like GNAT family acetyltransferase